MKTRIKHNRFLIVTPFTYPEFSGSGLNAFRFAKFLVGSNYPARILTFNRNKKYPGHELVENVPLRRMLYFNRNTLLKIISLIWIIPGYLLELTGTDIVYLYGSRIIGYQCLVLFANMLGKKVIFQSLLPGVDNPEHLLRTRNGRKKHVAGFIFSRISRYHSINSDFTVQYKKLLPGKNNWFEFPQGVDVNCFSPASHDEKEFIRNRLNLPLGEMVILTAGFMIERKRFDFLVDILSGLKFQFRLVMVGEYEPESDHFLRKELAAGSKDLNLGRDILGEKLILHGPRHDIMDYYRAADIYIHTALQEGLPNTILEAMAAAVPVICSRIPGLKNFVLFHESNCLIAEDKAGFRKHITELHDRPDMSEKIGSGGRLFVEENASYQRLLEVLKGNGVIHQG